MRPLAFVLVPAGLWPVTVTCATCMLGELRSAAPVAGKDGLIGLRMHPLFSGAVCNCGIG